jgi:hypothetical protein
MMGVVELESSNAPFKSKTGDSMKIFPRTLATKFLIMMMSFYYLRIL